MTTALATQNESHAPGGADMRPIAAGFLAAMAERDFARLRTSLADDLEVRALLPSGLLELESSDAMVERFQNWFGGVDEVTLLAATAEPFADVLRIAYRLRLSDHPFRPASGAQVIEHQLFCRIERGRIASFDLLCSGFRPDGPE